MAIPAPVSPSFCVPHETQLVVKRKSFSGRDYAVNDWQGILLFDMKVEGGHLSRAKRRIYDAASGRVLLLMMEEVKLYGRSWVAFRGDVESESELLFTLRKKSSFSSSYEVFLPGDNDSSSPDFSIKTNLWSKSFSILSNSRPIAEAKRNGWSWSRSDYTVTVYPDVDRAFVAAMTIIWIEERIRRANATVTQAAT